LLAEETDDELDAGGRLEAEEELLDTTGELPQMSPVMTGTSAVPPLILP